MTETTARQFLKRFCEQLPALIPVEGDPELYRMLDETPFDEWIWSRLQEHSAQFQTNSNGDNQLEALMKAAKLGVLMDTEYRSALEAHQA